MAGLLGHIKKDEDIFNIQNNYTKEQEEVLKSIKEHPEMLGDILSLLSSLLEGYKIHCERQNNWLLREALGDAVHLLALDRKPKDTKRYMIRIEKAIFANGINEHHHEGEKMFYRKYLEKKEN